MVEAAKIVTEKGVQVWRCPNCGQKLAEIIGNRVVIRNGVIMITLGVHSGPDQSCPKCGNVSGLQKERTG